MSGSVEVEVGHGFAHEGAWSTRVWLRPWNGRDEMHLREECAALPPAARTTALLARCAEIGGESRPAGAEFVRRLTVGDREALMLHLWRITAGERMACLLSCPKCGEELDLDLEAGSLMAAPASAASPERAVLIGEAAERFAVRFRLLNGGDQEALAGLELRDEEAAAAQALARCILRITDSEGTPVDGIPEPVAQQLPEAMAQADPQAEIVLEATCPGCGATIAAPFDAAQYVLRSIQQNAATLDREVHLLAWHYHWSEVEILDLTTPRRHRYLELIADTLSERGER